MLKTLTFLIFLLLLNQITSDELKDNGNIPQEDDFVFVLNEKNFDNFVNNNEITVVFFYAPWCGHCTTMKPFYHSAAKLLRQDDNYKSDKPVVFAKVDATVDQKLASKYNIQGYPTLKIIRKGVEYDYDGPRRDEKDIARYLINEASNEWKAPVSMVTVLTDANFTQWIENLELSLVEFYSPNCGHCIRLAPNYEKAARRLADLPTPIPLAKVDASKELELSRKYEISGYPTMLIFRKNRFYEYKGGRSEDEIVEYMLKQKLPSSRLVNSFNQFNINVKTPSQVYVLGLFTSKQDHLYEMYELLSSKYPDDIEFFHTFDAASFESYFKQAVVSFPSIVLFHHDLSVTKNEPKYKVFDKKENLGLKDLEEFLFSKSLPLVSFLNPKTKLLIYDKIRPLCYLFSEMDFELKTHIIFIRDKLAKIANEFKYVRFVLANENENQELMKSYHLEDTSSEINFVCLNEKSQIFVYDGEDDVDEMKSFVKKFLTGGKLKPVLRSELEPKDNEKKLVKKVVGKTFEELVEKANKDVFIGFVGQSHYENLDLFEARLTELASKYLKHNKNLFFGKINVQKNDILSADKFQQDIHRRPQLVFIPSKDKDYRVVFKYDDDNLDIKEFYNFVDNNLNKINKEKSEL